MLIHRPAKLPRTKSVRAWDFRACPPLSEPVWNLSGFDRCPRPGWPSAGGRRQTPVIRASLPGRGETEDSAGRAGCLLARRTRSLLAARGPPRSILLVGMRCRSYRIAVHVAPDIPVPARETAAHRGLGAVVDHVVGKQPPNACPVPGLGRGPVGCDHLMRVGHGGQAAGTFAHVLAQFVAAEPERGVPMLMMSGSVSILRVIRSPLTYVPSWLPSSMISKLPSGFRPCSA